MSRQLSGRNVPLFQDWDSILNDIESFLKAEAVIDISQSTASASFDEMFQTVLPALCRRLCELASRIGASAGDTSASVMICHSNDTINGVLKLRVFEAFPNYGLDRTINIREGKWNLHLREVHYKDSQNPAFNHDVVAAALLQRRDFLRSVDDNSKTPSEKSAKIVSIHSIIPQQLSNNGSLEEVKPGTVVALNIDFYDKASPATMYDTISRVNTLAKLLSDIYEISLIQSLTNEERTNGIKEFFNTVDKKQILNITLQELVKLFFSTLSH